MRATPATATTWWWRGWCSSAWSGSAWTPSCSGSSGCPPCAGPTRKRGRGGDPAAADLAAAGGQQARGAWPRRDAGGQRALDRRPAERRPRGRRGRAHLRARPLRLWQDDAAAGARGLPGPDPRRRAHRRRTGHPPRPAADLRLPGARPVPVADRRREHRFRPREAAARRAPGARRALRRAGRARRLRARLPARALWRHEATRRGGARPGDEPGRALPRRALRRARLDHPPHPAPRAAADLGSGAQDHRLRHPRHRGVDPARRPHRRDVAAPRHRAPRRGGGHSPPPRPVVAPLPRAARRHRRRDRAGAPRLMSVRRRLEALAWPASSFAAVLAAWQLAVTASRSTTFPAPLAVARGFAELAARGVLVPYTADSLMRVLGGFLLALSAGVPVGLVMGWYPPAARALEPVVQILRPISPLAWIPVSIVLFGIGNGATVFLIFLE